MSTLNAWDVTDANNNAAPPDGWPENTMQYSEVNNTGRAVQGTLKRYFADVNGSLQAGGVADAYTLTLNETGYTSYFQGMFFACEINATNTGASTINVNAIGVQNIIARNGGALVANTLEAGGIYEFRYDGTDFQLMGTLGAGVSIDQATLSNSAAVDLVDTDVALRTGAADPDTAQHLEITLDEIQSKSNATTAGDIFLNPLGGNTTIYSGVFVGTFAGDPTAGDDDDTRILFNETGGALTAEIGFPSGGDTNMRMFNSIWDGSISMYVNDSSGTERELAFMEVSGSQLFGILGGWEIFHVGGSAVVTTTADGIDVGPNGPNDALIDVIAVNGTADAKIGLRGAGSFGARLVHVNTTNLVQFWQTDGATGQTLQDIWWQCTPNAGVELYHNNIAKFTTTSTGATVTGDEGLRIDHAGGTLGLHLIDGVDRWTAGLDSNDLVIRDETNAEEMIRLISGGTSGEQHFLINSDDAFVVTDETAQVFGRVASNLPGYEWYLNTGVRLAYMRYGQSAGELQLRSERVEGDIVIEATNASSVVQRILTGDPDSLTQIRGATGITLDGSAAADNFIVCTLGDDVALFDNDVEVARTLPITSGGFQINNTLTGGGFERALTLSDLGDGTVTKILDAYTILNGVSIINTTLANALGFTVTLRGDSQGDMHRITGNCFFSNTTTAGTNPGLRVRMDSTGTFTGTAETLGTGQSDYGTNNSFTYDFPVDATVTTISINDTASGIGSFNFKQTVTPEQNSTTLQFQWAQNITNAGQGTTMWGGSNLQVYDYEAQ